SDLPEAFALTFVEFLRAAFARGVLRGYQRVEEAATTVRGRIRFDAQVTERYGLLLPVEVAYDDFTEDIELNRILKAALLSLSMRSLVGDKLRQSVGSNLALLSRVTPVVYDPRALPEFTYDRLNQHCRGAVEVAKFILRAGSFRLEHGRRRVSAFLVDMNKLFEDFVYAALRKALDLDEHSFPQGSSGHRLCLDGAGRVHLKPDLSWWREGRCIFVGDVKYKRTSEGENADLYQVLAYAVATGLPQGMLIYADAAAAGAVHEIPMAGKQIEVCRLDLGGSREELLDRVGDLAARIRTMAGECESKGPRLLQAHG
ncbi:MAG: restriction endonuclease, partial [Candidatus Dadabacteria bacterium]